MRYNLYLSSVVTANDEYGEAIVRKDLQPGSLLASSCGVTIKITEYYLTHTDAANVTFCVHGIKNSSVRDMIEESENDIDKFIFLLEDYIGVSLTDDAVINDHKYQINFINAYEQGRDE